MDTKSTLERAFELARSGKLTTVSELRTALKLEGHTSVQIEGPALLRQLRELIKTSRTIGTDL